VLQIVCKHGQPVHLPQNVVCNLSGEEGVELIEARSHSWNVRAALLALHPPRELRYLATPAVATGTRPS
jgi:hypothetical protein